MGTTTLLSLDQKLLEATGDWLQVTATTAIAASKLIVSTEFNNYDRGQNGIFDRYWVYIEDKANAGVSRQLGSTTYATSSGTAYVYGANLSTDSANLATVRISRSNWADRQDAILRSIGELYPHLYKSIDDRSLISGNALPNSHFEDDTSGLPTHYAASNLTSQTATTTAGLYRGQRGSQSIKLVASAGNGYLYITSNDWPQLLDLRDTTVSFKCWMYPEVADDVTLVIYTITADGTEQTLTSTTTTYADKWTLVELEDQEINDDITEIQFRFKITTNAKYVYIDDARVTGKTIYDYRLPDTIGDISKVYLQASGNSDDICDDISLSVRYNLLFGWDIIDDGLYKYLHIPYTISSKRRIKLEGTQPYEVLSSSSDTIATDDVGEVSLIVAYAAYLLHEGNAGPISADDTEKYDREMIRFYSKYQRLLMQHKKPIRSKTFQVEPL